MRSSRCVDSSTWTNCRPSTEGDSRLQGHPDVTRLPGLDASTGSLGQGLSAGVGMAIGARLAEKDFHTFVLMGDGEIQEGMVWEAVQVAARYKLTNLTAIVDRNGLQQFGLPSSSETSLTDRGDRRDPWFGVDLSAVFQAFGWRVLEINGHDYDQIGNAFRLARAGDPHGRPTVLLAHTVKGKGLSLAEGQHTWHSIVPTAEDFELARQELEPDETRRLGLLPRRRRRAPRPVPAVPVPRDTRRDQRSDRGTGMKAMRDVWGEKLVELGDSRSPHGGAGRRPGQLDEGRQVRQGPPGPFLPDGHRRAEPDRRGGRAGLGRLRALDLFVHRLLHPPRPRPDPDAGRPEPRERQDRRVVLGPADRCRRQDPPRRPGPGDHAGHARHGRARTGRRGRAAGDDGLGRTPTTARSTCDWLGTSFPTCSTPDYAFVPGAVHRLREGGGCRSGLHRAADLAGARRPPTSSASRASRPRCVHVPSLKPLDAAALVAAIGDVPLVVTVEEHSMLRRTGRPGRRGAHQRRRQPRIDRIGLDDVWGESAGNDFLLDKHGLSPARIADRVSACCQPRSPA